MTREEAINRYIIPAITKTWNDKTCRKIIDALLEPKTDKENIHREKEQAYMQGYEDASKKYREPKQGRKPSDNATLKDIFCMDCDVLEDIKAEIEDLEPTINHDFEGFYNCQHNVLRIIDNHINRKEQK